MMIALGSRKYEVKNRSGGLKYDCLRPGNGGFDHLLTFEQFLDD